MFYWGNVLDRCLGEGTVSRGSSMCCLVHFSVRQCVVSVSPGVSPRCSLSGSLPQKPPGRLSKQSRPTTLSSLGGWAFAIFIFISFSSDFYPDVRVLHWVLKRKKKKKVAYYHPTSFHLLPVFILNDFPLRINSLLDTFIWAFFSSQNASLVCLTTLWQRSRGVGWGASVRDASRCQRPGEIALPRPAHCCSSCSSLRGSCDLWSLTRIGSVSHRVLPVCVHPSTLHLRSTWHTEGT